MTDTPKQFIEQRLKSLNDIDANVALLLDNMAEVFDTYASSNNNYEQAKTSISQQTKVIYQTISDIAVNLRKEVRIMDENIGIYDQNDDGVMILPIAVEQKNTALGKRRLNEELEQLKKLIPEKPTKEQLVWKEDKSLKSLDTEPIVKSGLSEKSDDVSGASVTMADNIPLSTQVESGNQAKDPDSMEIE